MSIASPTRRKGSTNQSTQGTQRISWWRRGRSFIESQYRHTAATSLKGVPLLLILIAVGLTVFGLVMVLSASSVEQIAQGRSPFSQVSKQGTYAGMGLFAMGVIAVTPVNWYRRGWVLYTAMSAAILLQAVTAVAGVEVNGNRNWINLGFMQVQPSEFSKLIFALWGAWVLMNQGEISRKTRKALFPLLFGVGLLALFIVLGHDIGTILVYALMVIGLLWFAGLNFRAMLMGLGVAAVLGFTAVAVSPNRIARLAGTFLGHCQDSTCDQSNAGLAALATGGFWGVGLGRSRQKYNYLPEAHNDYIFAVVGEELGLVGTMIIIFLYLGLLYCCIRIMVRTADRFIALATGAIMVWLIGQAMINIAMVSGLLPVIGIPLPLISYGGSSLITSLVAIGILIAFARQTPMLPITSDGTNYSYASSTEYKDQKRRRILSDIVARDNRRLDRAGENAGWDIKDILLRMLGGSTAASSPQPAARRRPQTRVAASAQAPRKAQRTATSSARPTPRGTGTSQRSRSDHAPTRVTSRTGSVSRKKASGSSPQTASSRRNTGAEKSQSSRKNTAAQPPTTGARKKQEKLPPGLVPLRKKRGSADRSKRS